MTQEDKELLLKDLCARLPYGLKGTVEIEVSTGEYSIESGHLLFIEKEIDVELFGINKETEEIEVCPLNDNIDISEYDYTIDDFILYLRTMSSMTEEEMAEFKWLNSKCDNMPTFDYIPIEHYRLFDWLNRHHFDYRGFIEKGLAIEAQEGMYGREEQK